jgi:hypothetical protein
MLLSIVTRTFHGRPQGLQRCIDSVAAQYGSSRLIQHYMAVDRDKRGIGWSHTNLATIEPNLTGEYVMLLDDDDYLIDDSFVWDLARYVEERNPQVVMVKMEMEDGRILPIWEVEPHVGGVAISNHISRRDVFREHVQDFGGEYSGDASYIEAVWKCGHPFDWWDRLVAKVGRVSHGAGE